MKMESLLDDWKVGTSGWSPESVTTFESLLSIGNGRFGQRANFEEVYGGQSLQGSYLAGIYYPDKTRVGWWKNGYPDYFAKVLNSTNWIGIDIEVNGEVLDLNEAKSIRDFEWTVDMREGVLRRSFVVEMSQGQFFSVETERFCSMDQPEIAALRYTIKALSSSLFIELNPYLEGNVRNQDSNWDDAFWTFHASEANEQGHGVVHSETNKSGFHAALSMANQTHLLCGSERTQVPVADHDAHESKARSTFTCNLGMNDAVVLEKFIGVLTSLQVEASSIVEQAKRLSIGAMAEGFDQLKLNHVAAWSNVWNRADIRIQGDAASQQSIRFNIFHLNQTYRGDDPRLNIGPKGFTGEKYGGASYWDTEAYCLPFYLAGHEGNVARQLLLYRYNHLEKAIENASKLGFSDGAALFPMVTMNGEECHNEWEITFEEIHRNGAMAYAIWNYVNYTGDRHYLLTHGFEVLLAIARFWEQRVQWSQEKEAYVILGVTGPNEYENNVNNNWYTNYIASWCLQYTKDVAVELMQNYPEEWKSIVKRLSFDFETTTPHWTSIASGMHYPQLKGSAIFLQQDGFMDKEQIAAIDLNPEERPINQHWSWDRILRSVFIKQADVLQGMYFFWDDFTETQIDANYSFYEPKTLHESSLSPCVHAVIASRLRRDDEAYSHYLRTARLDLDDYNAEVHEGLHITSMAGTWLSVVEGFGGFRVREGVPCFDGRLPKQWKELAFQIFFRERLIAVELNEKGTRVRLVTGDSIDIKIMGELQTLKSAQ
jgi:maltose phosphorylase